MNGKKIILIESEGNNTEMIESFLENNGFLYITTTIDHLISNFHNYHDDILLLPEKFVDIIDDRICGDPYLINQDVILISSNNGCTNLRKREGVGLNIIECINGCYPWIDEFRALLTDTLKI